MFTGLAEEVGRITEILRQSESVRLTLQANRVLEGTRVGDSICISGCCLTVVQINGNQLSFEMMAETLRRTANDRLKSGDFVNLERALSFGDRLGGHLVQGHVDGIGKLTGIRQEGSSKVFHIMAPQEFLLDVILKGSVTVDGISLTVAGLGKDFFEVALIPETQRSTTLGMKRVGDLFNLESDLIGKYVRRYLEKSRSHEGLTAGFLAENGFV